MRTLGRALQRGSNAALEIDRQWPGTYFETEIKSKNTFFKLGAGEVALKISVDQDSVRLVKPAPGMYRIDGVKTGRHRVRVDVISESQKEPTAFDGFYGDSATSARTLSPVRHQIEFIGDSHTVGYGNTSPTRDCKQADVWVTTDSSQGIAPLVAQRFKADYQINAISGRGIVRNYGGYIGDTVPQAYPFVLLNHDTRYEDAQWKPQAIVIALGTNDFSTPLHDGEKWKTRDELHADFEKTYFEFVQQLRAKNPHAYFVLWATDIADGEITTEVQRVVEKLNAAGEKKLVFLSMKDLQFSACNSHPSLADDRKIADALSIAIRSGVRGWK